MTTIRLLGETLTVTMASSTGPHGTNQDSCGWYARTSEGAFLDGTPVDSPGGEFLVAIVCDGLGGLEQGETASRTVVDMVLHAASSVESHGLLMQALLVALIQCETAIPEGSGTTVAMIVGTPEGWFTVHLGDSRCHAVLPFEVRRTTDHTPREGSNLVSRFIGNGDPIPEVNPVDRFNLLCITSDGVHSQPGFEEVLRQSMTASDLLPPVPWDDATAVHIMPRLS